MPICVLLVALTFSSAAAHIAALDEFRGVEFFLPKGWSKAQKDGKLILAPNETANELVVVLVLSPEKKLGKIGEIGVRREFPFFPEIS